MYVWADVFVCRSNSPCSTQRDNWGFFIVDWSYTIFKMIFLWIFIIGFFEWKFGKSIGVLLAPLYAKLWQIILQIINSVL